MATAKSIPVLDESELKDGEMSVRFSEETQIALLTSEIGKKFLLSKERFCLHVWATKYTQPAHSVPIMGPHLRKVSSATMATLHGLLRR